MPKKKIEIPISQPIGDCHTYWNVRYKKNTDSEWTSLAENVTISPAVVYNLDEGVTYDIEVTAMCCNGVKSAAVLTTVNT